MKERRSGRWSIFHLVSSSPSEIRLSIASEFQALRVLRPQKVDEEVDKISEGSKNRATCWAIIVIE